MVSQLRNLLTSKARITAIGLYVPDRVLTNADLEKLVDTSDEWIVKRTGIRERRIAADNEFTSDLCIAAVKDMVARFHVDLSDVDMIIVSTTTPDLPVPSVATQVQDRLGLTNAGAYDIAAACAGFVYGLSIANGLITSGMHRRVLVFGAETLSKVTDYTDRTTCILFGDGAGVALVEYTETNPSFLKTSVRTYGAAGVHLYRTGLATNVYNTELQGDGNLVQNGREVFRLAVTTLSEEIPAMLADVGITMQDIDWFVPHSANLRITEAVCERLGIDVSKTIFSGEYFGNTSSATIPLSLCLGYEDNRIKPGDLVLLSGFGGGFVYTSTLIRWTL